MNTVHKLKPRDALLFSPFNRDGYLKTIEWFKAHIRLGELKKIRQSVGITQERLGFYCEKSQTEISRLERKDFTNVSDNELMATVYDIHNAFWICNIDKKSEDLHYGDSKKT